MPKKKSTRLRQTKITGLRSSKKRKEGDQSPKKSTTPLLDSPVDRHASSPTKEEGPLVPTTVPEKESVDDQSDQRMKTRATRNRSRPQAAKIHQESMSETDKMLRAFDLNYDYGPCVGMTRMQRWERATMLGLDPPQEVKTTLEKFGDMACLFEER